MQSSISTLSTSSFSLRDEQLHLQLAQRLHYRLNEIRIKFYDELIDSPNWWHEIGRVNLAISEFERDLEQLDESLYFTIFNTEQDDVAIETNILRSSLSSNASTSSTISSDASISLNDNDVCLCDMDDISTKDIRIANVNNKTLKKRFINKCIRWIKKLRKKKRRISNFDATP